MDQSPWSPSPGALSKPSQSAHIHNPPEGLICGVYNQVISLKEQTCRNIAVCSAFSGSSDLNGKKKIKGRSRDAAHVTAGPIPRWSRPTDEGRGGRNPLQSHYVRGAASSNISPVYFLLQHRCDPSPLRLSSLLPFSSSWHLSKQRIVAAFLVPHSSRDSDC